MWKPVPGITQLRNETAHSAMIAEGEPVGSQAYSTRWTVSIENAGRQTAMYSAPPSSGVE